MKWVGWATNVIIHSLIFTTVMIMIMRMILTVMMSDDHRDDKNNEDDNSDDDESEDCNSVGGLQWWIYATTKPKTKSIPVGWVPPTCQQYSIVSKIHVSGRGRVSNYSRGGEYSPPLERAWDQRYPPPWTEWLTDSCKNITCPGWRTVKTDNSDNC